MQLRTEVEIEAPAAAVWAVLTDFSAYPEWNPFIASIQGKLEVGAKLNVRLTPPGGRGFTVRPTVVLLEPERELCWQGHFLLKGLFDGKHFFRLVEKDPGVTRLVHGEDFGGALVKRMGGVLTQTARGFVAMNHALRRRVLERQGDGPAPRP